VGATARTKGENGFLTGTQRYGHGPKNTRTHEKEKSYTRAGRPSRPESSKKGEKLDGGLNGRK